MNKKSNRFSPEMLERAVHIVQEHRSEYQSSWAAIESIATKVGCVTPTLLEWVKKAEVVSGQREGVTSIEREQLKALEPMIRELRRANEFLKLASVFFAQA
jgi:transposase